MVVLKFGGTSVGTAEALRNVDKIVKAATGEVIVVVSALSGVTDQLQDMVRQAAKHDSAWEGTFKQMRERHIAIMRDVVPADRQEMCYSAIKAFIDDGLYLYLCMLQINPPLDDAVCDDMTDSVLCHGEMLSSIIVTCMIDGAMPHYAPNFIKTRDTATERILDAESTERLIRQEFAAVTGGVHVTQGFISSDVSEGYETNLGRGGSDFTAALIAAALDAEALEIWTDVDGFMTADPKTDPDARVMPQMTYAQAQRMCDSGAKVVYAPTLLPVSRKHIPVWVKNTFNPAAPGTKIAD